MLPDNPFFAASGQLIDYFLPRTGALRSKLTQATDGEQVVSIFLYPSEPPSPFGYMEIDLNFDCGELSNLEYARDFGQGEWLPENGPIMISQRTYHAPHSDVLSTDEQFERIGEVLALRAEPSLSIFADQWVDLTQRNAWVGGELVEASRVSVGFSEHYELIDIHATDWRREGGRILEQLADLAEAATGSRPVMAGIDL